MLSGPFEKVACSSKTKTECRGNSQTCRKSLLSKITLHWLYCDCLSGEIQLINNTLSFSSHNAKIVCFVFLLTSSRNFLHEISFKKWGKRHNLRFIFYFHCVTEDKLNWHIYCWNLTITIKQWRIRRCVGNHYQYFSQLF